MEVSTACQEARSNAYWNIRHLQIQTCPFLQLNLLGYIVLQLSNFLIVLSDLFLVILYVTLQTLYRDFVPALGRIKISLPLFQFLKLLLNSTRYILSSSTTDFASRSFQRKIAERDERSKLSRRSLTEEPFNRPLVRKAN